MEVRQQLGRGTASSKTKDTGVVLQPTKTVIFATPRILESLDRCVGV